MDKLTIIGPAKMLLAAVTGYLDENYPDWRMFPERAPTGLRLEVHPHVYYTVMSDPDSAEWAHGITGDLQQAMTNRFGLPVKVTMDLPDRTWRLVVVTEDVKLGGTL